MAGVSNKRKTAFKNTNMDLEYCHKHLSEAGVKFAPGLSDTEIGSMEREFGFKMPPDLKAFLSYALPVSEKWVNWREGSREEIRERLYWPYEGICFDIEHNDFCLASWGNKPQSLKEAFNKAKIIIDKAPKLIPIYSHRYIPDSPEKEGNPILSVYLTDIIFYGTSLQNYLENEFHHSFKSPNCNLKESIRKIEFWAELIEENC